MKFFSQFPKTNLKVYKDRTETELTDIFRHVDVNETLIDDISSYIFYEIQDGERPDVVSYKLYGKPDFHWSFFIANEHLKDGLKAWPRSYREQETYINEKYDKYSVIEFIPFGVENSKYSNNGIFASDVLGFGTENHFGSLVFKGDTPKYRLIDKDTGRSAPIQSYDAERLQIWVTDLPDTNFISNGYKEYRLDYDYKDLEERDCWLQLEIIPWLQEYKRGLYTLLINDERINDDDILPYVRGSVDPIEAEYFSGGSFAPEGSNTYTFPIALSGIITTDDVDNTWGVPVNNSPMDSPQEYIVIEGVNGSVDEIYYDSIDNPFPYTLPLTLQGDFTIPPSFEGASVDEYPNISLYDVLYDHYLPEITFKTERSWLKSYNAPFSYYNNKDVETEILSFFRVNVSDDPNVLPEAVSEFNDYTNFEQYYEREESINLERRNIRTIRSSDIEEFAEYYTELIND